MVGSSTSSSGGGGTQAPGLASVFAGLLGADPSACDRGGLAELVARSQRVRAWLDAFDTRIAIQAAMLAAKGESESAGSVLAGQGRRSQRDAEAAASRAGVCDSMPKVHDALADGSISAGHVDAIANATASLDNDDARAQLADLEDSLVGATTAMPVETFERECQQLARILAGDDGLGRHQRHRRARRVRRWVDRQSGMCKTLIELDAETDALMWTAINAAIAAARANPQDDELTFDQLQVDALVALITGARSTDQRVAEISALIDLETLVGGLHEGSVCETSDGAALPTETIRPLCCDGDIIPVVLGGHGEVLDVGRGQRLANRAQRRALRAMYRTCAHPNCQVRFDHCRIYHVTPWEQGGPTDLDQLIPLCDRHHHLVHEGGWTPTLGADRTITLSRPDGTVHFSGSTIDRTHPAPPQRDATDPPAETTDAVPTDVTDAVPTDVTDTPRDDVTGDADSSSADDQSVGVPHWIFDLFDNRTELRRHHHHHHDTNNTCNNHHDNGDDIVGEPPVLVRRVDVPALTAARRTGRAPP